MKATTAAIVLAFCSFAFAAPLAPTKTIPTKVNRRQFTLPTDLSSLFPSGLASLEGGDDLSSLFPSGLASLGSFDDLGDLSDFLKKRQFSFPTDLSSLFPSGLASLEGGDDLSSLFPSGLASLGDLDDLGDFSEFLKKRQFSFPTDLSSLFPSGLASLGGSSSLGDFSDLIPTSFPSLMSGGGDWTSMLSDLESGSGSSELSSLMGGLRAREAVQNKAKREAVQEKAKRASSVSSITENGVTSKAACQPLTFIFARGTTEMGNMGSVVGPPVASALASLTNNQVVVQGVDYPASVEGNAELGASGGPTMASLVKQAISQCPNTTVVLGGYSQGAMVVHYAANQLSSGQVKAAVLFGDPLKAQSVGKLSSSAVKEFCAVGDPVCENGFNVMAHLTYGSDAQSAAQFLVQAAGVSS